MHLGLETQRHRLTGGAGGVENREHSTWEESGEEVVLTGVGQSRGWG